jgi:hypothetical protein
MCVQISGPTLNPASVFGGKATASIRVRSASPTTVTVTCDPGELGPVQTRTRTVGPGAIVTVQFTVNASGAAPGVYTIIVTVDQPEPECAPESRAVTLTVLVPALKVKV